MINYFPVHLGQELLKKSDACVELASAGDIKAARSLLNELRFVRHLFAAELANEQRNLDLEQIDEKSKSLISKLNRSLEILKNWLSSISSSFSTDALLATPEGLEILLDTNLPLTWSWEEDLVIVSGTLPVQIINALVARGQKKIIYLKSGESNESIKYVSEPSTAYESLASWSTDHIGRSIYLASSQADNPPKDILEEISRITLDFRIAQNTRAHFARTWVLQQLQSLPHVIRSRSILALKAEIKDKHCIVVSPGPSLEKNIELLKTRDSSQLVIAVAQAAPALAKHSVQADYIIVMDPIDYSFTLDDTNCSQVKGLIIGDACHNSFFEKNFPCVYTFFNIKPSFKVDEIIGSDMTLPGGSVSVGAAMLSVMFGASHLTLVGQDLAISDGRYYGGYFHTEDIDTHCLISVPGFYGDDVITKPDYASFIREFERIALHYSSKTILNNCTEGGAFIEGFNHVPLADSLKLKGKKRDAFVPHPVSKSELQQRIKSLSLALSSERDNLAKTHKLALQCSKLMKKIKNSSDPKLHALKRKEKQLSLSVDRSAALQIFCQLEVSSTLRHIKNARTFDDNKKLSAKLFETLTQASSLLHREVSTLLQNK